MRLRLAVLFLVVLSSLVACAGGAWKRARSEDTVAAYHGFLREYPSSDYAEEARARMEFVRVRNKPSREAFDHFRKKWPESPLVDELRPFVEEYFFAAARARGTVAAYQEFLADFPDGAQAARARGNAEYVEKGGFSGRLDALADFAKRHPESDYAAEAQRSVASVSVRAKSGFRRVALVLDIHPTTPGADRLARVFSERARAAYEAAGIELLAASGPKDPRLAGVAARLVIAHREKAVRTKLENGQVSQPGILVETRVSLFQTGHDEPIWKDAFEYRASLSEQRKTESVLFGAGTEEYWKSFFVPIATWDTRVAARDPRAFEKEVRGVETVGSRAVVLFADGEFQIFDLSDPASPVPLGSYERPRDLASFEGVRAGAGRMAIYGVDGIELVALWGDGLGREASLGREEVGSVVGVELIGDELVVASNRGLLWLASPSATPRTLVPREILGLARVGDRLLFSDGLSLYVSTLPLLKAGRIESELRLGRGFGPGRIRTAGASALVIGEHGVVWVDVTRPATPRIVSRIGTDEAGAIEDAAIVGGRIFLLGSRGLQVSDRSGERVVESVDVEARQRLASAGRHLVMVGAQRLQVVDGTPFFAQAPAAPGE